MGDRHDEDVWREERDRLRWEADQLVADNEKRAADRRRKLRLLAPDAAFMEDNFSIETRWDEARAERDYRNG